MPEDEEILAIKADQATRLQKAGLSKDQRTRVSQKLSQIADAIIGALVKDSKFRGIFFEDPLTAIKKFKNTLMEFNLTHPLLMKDFKLNLNTNS